jgi:hypothetical protein
MESRGNRVNRPAGPGCLPLPAPYGWGTLNSHLMAPSRVVPGFGPRLGDRDAVPPAAAGRRGAAAESRG